jgi:hypothetical protein
MGFEWMTCERKIENRVAGPMNCYCGVPAANADVRGSLFRMAK